MVHSRKCFFVKYNVMKTSKKFCRCVKTVRKRLGEKGAIGVCVKTMLQRKGRTLKKFNCGKKSRLVTQKLKKKGGAGELTWPMIKELADRIEEEESQEERRVLLERIIEAIREIDPPEDTILGRESWFDTFTDLIVEAKDNPTEEIKRAIRTIIKRRRPGDERLDLLIVNKKNRFLANPSPEQNSIGKVIEEALGPEPL